MPKDICDKHGIAAFFHTCPHVAEEIDNRRYGQFYKAMWVDGHLLFCEDCLHKYRLERLTILTAKDSHTLVDRELHGGYWADQQQVPNNKENWTFRCYECVAEVQAEQANKNV